MDENELVLQVVVAFVTIPYLLKHWFSIEKVATAMFAVVFFVLLLLLLVGAALGSGGAIPVSYREELPVLFYVALKSTAVCFCILLLVRACADEQQFDQEDAAD